MPDPTLRPEPEQVAMDALSVAAAADRLGFTSDAVRMRLKRGSLAGRKVEGRWVVLLPRPNGDPTGSERQDASSSSETQRSTERDGDDANAPAATRELIEALRSENAFLRDELAARTEEIRRRDHIIAGFIERLPELPATTGTGYASQDANPAPVRSDDRDVVPNPCERLRRRRAGRMKASCAAGGDG